MRRLRKGHAHRLLVERVAEMRLRSGDALTWQRMMIARMYGVPLSLILSPRELGIKRRRSRE